MQTINDLDEIGMTDAEIAAALGRPADTKPSVVVDLLLSESERRATKAARGVRRLA